MKTGLAVILCGIDDWENRGAKFEDGMLGEVEGEITARIGRLLRCYDSMGRYGGGEFLVVLPGCNSFNAVGMADRLSCEVFGAPVSAGGEELVFAASFGIAGSGGRSPLVVLRNAEHALRNARMRGGGSIERSSCDAEPDPATLLIPVIEHETLHW
jgi:diguanylate cyclase (GGDEF)-like protein